MQKIALIFIFPLLIALGPTRICQMEPIDNGTSQVAEYENSHCHGTDQEKPSDSRDNCHHCESACCHTFVSEVFDLKVVYNISEKLSLDNFKPYLKQPHTYSIDTFRPPILS